MSVAEEVAKLERRRLAGEISQSEFEAQVARVAAGLRVDVDTDAETTADDVGRGPSRGVPDPFGGVPPLLPRVDSLKPHQEPSGPQRHGEPVPSRLGAYKLVELVGQGGMGLVYAAKHLVRPGLFAIKVPRPHLAADPEFVRRFRREARVGLKLDHPGIVKVHDLIIDGEYPAIVMDFVSGANLDTLLRNTGGPLAWGRTADIFGQVLEAMGYAHSLGCIHRDIKPKNVLVRLDGRTLVTDFGLAHITRDEATQTDVLLGTATYLAPEVYAAGAAADARSDIYALGMTLYKMLVGRSPFDPGTPAYKIMRLKESGDVPPPSTLQATLPPEVDALVMRALSPDPADRYQDCASFAVAVRRVMTSLQAQPTVPMGTPSGGLQAQATLVYPKDPKGPTRHPDDESMDVTLDGMPNVFSAASDDTLDGEASAPARPKRTDFVAPTVQAPAVGRQAISAPRGATTRSGRRLIAGLAVLLLVAIGANVYLLLNDEARGLGGRFLRSAGDPFGDALRDVDRRSAVEADLSEDLPPGRTPVATRISEDEVDWDVADAPGSAVPQAELDETPSAKAHEVRAAAAQEVFAVGARNAVTRHHGTLYLTSRPPSTVEIDGVPYGTTEVTRKGVPLPEGRHVVRFRCDDPACANLRHRAAKKTVFIEAGRTLRFHADFVELNQTARLKSATPSPTPVPSAAEAEPGQ
jgi:serine/threonine protein kinase